MVSEKIQVIVKIIAGMILIQILRFSLESAAFCFVDRTQQTDRIVSSGAMLVLSIIIILIAKKKNISLSVFPNKNRWVYIIATVFVLILIALSLLIAEEKSFFSVSALAHTTVITPVFEELIFRGWVWNKLKVAFSRRLEVFAITTLLFAVWHLGYIDSVAFRVNPANLPFIMLMKVITGLFFGIVLGAARDRTKNCYSTILLHSAMNIFGR